MRVLMTADAVGGVWTYALALAEGLRSHGVEVTLATMGPRPTIQQRCDAYRSGVTALHESDYRLEWMADPWCDVDAAGDWLLGLAKRTGADLVHVNGYAHAALPWRVPVVATAHSCVLSWWKAVRNADAPAEWDAYRRRVRLGLDAAEVVVFPTRALHVLMEAEHGAIPRSRVIRNGVRGGPLPLAAKEPIVLAAGRFCDEGKNLTLLQDVGSRIRWPLFVAGDWEAGGGSGRPYGVRTLGRLEQSVLRQWQSRAAIAVHPARYEPFGYAPLEAAQANCALVLSDIPSLRELWDGAALFAHPDDAAGMATAVSRLIAEPATLTVLRARAARRARAYSADATAAAYAAVYSEVVGAQVRGRRVACAS